MFEDIQGIEVFLKEQARLIGGILPALHSLAILGRRRGGYMGWTMWSVSSSEDRGVVLEEQELTVRERYVSCSWSSLPVCLMCITAKTWCGYDAHIPTGALQMCCPRTRIEPTPSVRELTEYHITQPGLSFLPSA